ncbi:MAG: RNA methyltransferase [Betaproteobacteria bacterium]|nr:RNA methyltransferase [Betaproteobacteria bacterium]
MKRIASRDNPFLKHLRKLLTSTAVRREVGQTVLDGPHLVAAYLGDTNNGPVDIAVSQSGLGRPEIRALADRAESQRVCVVEDAAFKSLSPSETPSGIVAVVTIPRAAANATANCLLLEGIQDPGNLGSMLRTARAAGFSQIYLSPGCADAWSPKCLRGGMGAHFGLCIEEDAALGEVLRGFAGTSVACDPRAQRTVYDISLPTPLAVVVGAEGAGLSCALLGATTQRCRIPMSGQTESLNAGVAAAIVMYEHVRQCTHGQRSLT